MKKHPCDYCLDKSVCNRNISNHCSMLEMYKIELESQYKFSLIYATIAHLAKIAVCEPLNLVGSQTPKILNSIVLQERS